MIDLLPSPTADGRIEWTCTACGKRFNVGTQLTARHRCGKIDGLPDKAEEQRDDHRLINELRGDVCIVTRVASTPQGGGDAIRAKVEGPSLLQKAANFNAARKQHAAAGKPKATDEQVAARFAICQSNVCGLFQANGEGSGTCLHKSCGCNLKAVGSESMVTPNKLRWADTRCPVGKWGPVEISPP